MRATSVSLFANEEEAIRFDLRNVESRSRYMVKAMVGLDVDDITHRFYGFSKDGTKKFYNPKLKPRDVVMRVVLNPRYALNESHSEIRDELYRTISATRTGEISLEFNTSGSTIARLYGHITKFEVPYFSKVPELQMTIRANDPMFRGINPVVMTPEELGTTTTIEVGDGLSTAPHGFKTSVTLTSTLSDFVIRDRASNPEWDFVVSPATNFLAGDVLHFSSEFNNTYFYMVRSGVTTHLLDKVQPGSVWPIIFPRFNQFYLPGAAAFDFGNLEFYPAYWGI